MGGHDELPTFDLHESPHGASTTLREGKEPFGDSSTKY